MSRVPRREVLGFRRLDLNERATESETASRGFNKTSGKEKRLEDVGGNFTIDSMILSMFFLSHFLLIIFSGHPMFSGRSNPQPGMGFSEACEVHRRNHQVLTILS